MDIESAFDTIDHTFIINLLKNLAFGKILLLGLVVFY